jgi:hypothetical protein
MLIMPKSVLIKLVFLYLFVNLSLLRLHQSITAQGNRKLLSNDYWA